MNPLEEEIQNLKDARKKIDARIKELENSDRYKDYDTVLITKGEGGRSALWKSVYRLKVRKHSSRVESEEGRYKTIIEEPDLEKLRLYLVSIITDLKRCLNDIELTKEVKNENNDQDTV